MSFQAFEKAIVSPALKPVASHWNEARGSKQMPAWSDIRPSKISAQLPIVWAYKYDRKADAFVGRLSGNLIDQMFGKNFRGVPMTEIYAPNEYARLFARAKRVVTEPAFYRGEGMVFRHVDRLGQGERIIMPLADNDSFGDGIIGATVYQSVTGRPFADAGEAESWFLL